MDNMRKFIRNATLSRYRWKRDCYF